MNNKKITRRQILQILGLSAAGAVAYQLGIRPQLDGLAEVSVSRVLMGTVVNLTVVGEDEAAARTAVTATLDQMSQLEAILSRHQATSQLSLLNEYGKLDQPSSHLVAVLRQAQEISSRSNGAFDVTVKPLVDLYQSYKARKELPPETAVDAVLSLVNYRNLDIASDQIAFSQPGMAVTVDGIGKGYIVDTGTETLKEHGFVNVLVEAGGDLMAAGRKSAEQPWRLGIQSPRGGAAEMLARFSLSNQAAATSGDYMQAFTADMSQHHIIDPRTGYSAPELASVTVTAPTAMMADGLATAVMVLGYDRGLTLINQLPGVESYLVTKEMKVGKSKLF